MGPQLGGKGESGIPDLGYLMSPLFQGVLGEFHLSGSQHRRGLGVPGFKRTLIFWWLLVGFLEDASLFWGWGISSSMVGGSWGCVCTLRGSPGGF